MVEVEFIHHMGDGALMNVAMKAKPGMYALIMDVAANETQGGLELKNAVHLKQTINPRLMPLEEQFKLLGLGPEGASIIPILYCYEFRSSALLIGPLEDVAADKFETIYYSAERAGFGGDRFRLIGFNMVVPPGMMNLLLGGHDE